MAGRNAEIDVLVIGAGIVGVSSALWTQRQGLSVALADGNPPGSGASYGNAGAIAGYGCVPVNAPELIQDLPKLLTSKSAPLRIDWFYAVRNLPWMIAFLRACQPDRVEHTTKALANLLAHIDAGLNPLLTKAGANNLLVANDFIYAWGEAESAEAAESTLETRKKHGVKFERLTGADIATLEPGITMKFHSGVRFQSGRHVINPEELVQRFARKFTADGGKMIESHVSGVAPDAEGVDVTFADGSKKRVGQVVVAAGAHAKSIVGSGAEDLPLGIERGYHVAFAKEAHRVTRPVAWAEGAFYATPMATGLRLAGTVEIASLKAPPTPARIDALTDRAHKMFGDIGAPTSTWLGFRPTMPDSLPVIGPSHRSDRIIFAFGHQHLGLTLGGITGRIVADLCVGRQPNFDIADYAPSRFRRAFWR